MLSIEKDSPVQILRLCWLALFDPEEFSRLEKEDGQLQHAHGRGAEPRKIDLVREGLWQAFLLTFTALLFGSLLGLGVAQLAASKVAVGLLGGLGALILLWALLGVRGWEIQTIRGTSLSEKVNRWLYRSLSWVGTALLAAAAVIGAM